MIWRIDGELCKPISIYASYIDAALFGEDDLPILFSFSHAYFVGDMETLSAYMQFLSNLMPRNDRVREVFMKHHADLLAPAFWQGHYSRAMTSSMSRCDICCVRDHWVDLQTLALM